MVIRCTLFPFTLLGSAHNSTMGDDDPPVIHHLSICISSQWYYWLCRPTCHTPPLHMYQIIIVLWVMPTHLSYTTSPYVSAHNSTMGDADPPVIHHPSICISSQWYYWWCRPTCHTPPLHMYQIIIVVWVMPTHLSYTTSPYVSAHNSTMGDDDPPVIHHPSICIRSQWYYGWCRPTCHTSPLHMYQLTIVLLAMPTHLPYTASPYLPAHNSTMGDADPPAIHHPSMCIRS